MLKEKHFISLKDTPKDDLMLEAPLFLKIFVLSMHSPDSHYQILAAEWELLPVVESRMVPAFE